MVLPDSHGISRVPRYSGTVLATFDLGYGGFTLYAETFQTLPLSTHGSIITALQPRMVETTRFGLFPFRSPLLWESLLISFPQGTEMFHFPWLAPWFLWIQNQVTELLLPGCPIQRFRGRRIFGFYPRLIAAYHVFLRLLTPRHPPVALKNLFSFLLSLFNCQRTPLCGL